MSKPIVRICLPNATTRGSPTYPSPMTATVFIQVRSLIAWQGVSGHAWHGRLHGSRAAGDDSRQVGAGETIRAPGARRPAVFDGVEHDRGGIIAATRQAIDNGERLGPRVAGSEPVGHPVDLPDAQPLLGQPDRFAP
jgi:hypothetical protein